MRKQSKISAFLFGEIIPIEKSKLNYKQQICYEWDRFCRALTNMFIWLLYNGLAGLGWYAIVSNQSVLGVGWVDGIASSSAIALYGVGHGVANVGQWLINKFTKSKSRNDMVQEGSPLPRKSAIGITFLVITILPMLVWLFGRVIISIKCHRYVRKHGSIETDAQKRTQSIQEKVAEKTEIVEIATEFMKAMKKD